MTGALERQLVAAGERLVRVPPKLTAPERRAGRKRGKSDAIDALAAARAALREPNLDRPRRGEERFHELKLLADTRDQLIVEAGRWRNRAHALLRVASPGYQAKTGALASAGSVRRARAIAKRSVAHDPVRGRLAVQALDRLAALERDAGKLEREIRELLRIRGCTHLLAIRGVGPIVAATILGETRGIGRFLAAPPPPSPPTAAPHRSPPPAGARNDTGSTAAATDSSTGR